MTRRTILTSSLVLPLAAILLIDRHISLAQPGPTKAQLIDGSKTPWLIADTHMYSLVFLLATTPTKNAQDVENRRAEAFVKSLNLTPSEEGILLKAANLYRTGRESLSNTSPDVLEQNSEKLLKDNLSDPSKKAIEAFMATERAKVAIYPIPDMLNGRSSDTVIGRLIGLFSLTAVHAQNMNFSGASTYTNVTVDADGVVYATGITNGTSGCNCHQTYAGTTLTFPSGNSVFATAYGPGEVAQATVSLTLDDSDFTSGGSVSASTTHSARCPVLGMVFINGVTSGFMQSPQVSVKRGYYKCETDPATPSVCKVFGGGKRALYDHCVPNGFCDTLNYNIAKKGAPTLYRQIQAGRYMGFCGALWNAYADTCSPDY